MNFQKDVLEAVKHRVVSPFFGNLALFAIILNWQPIYFLLFSDVDVMQKFEFFEKATQIWFNGKIISSKQ